MPDPQDSPPEARGFTPETPLHGRRVFTAGHAGMDLAFFVQLMRDYGICAVADLRHRYESPSDVLYPDALRLALKEVWIDYSNLAAALGNRPLAPGYAGHGDEAGYQILQRDSLYREGITQVMELMGDEPGHHVCLLCYHPSPLACHRDYLVGRTLAEKGAEIEHILCPGEVKPEKEDCSF